MNVVATRSVPGLATLYLAQAGDDPLRLVEFVDTLEPGVPKAAKWVLMVSTQVGCPVGCSMCDGGALGWRGNLGAEEIIAQVRRVLADNPALDARAHPKLKVHFARLGEPALNPFVLDALKLLAQELPGRGTLPSLSTVAPKSPAALAFFERLLQVKDEHFGGGRFQLQFSVHALEEARRRELVPMRTWSLEEIARYGARFSRPGERKVTLNFALPEGETPDAARLAALFAPEKFLVKITPVNPTGAAQASGAAYAWVKPPSLLEACAADLRARGFEVIFSPSAPEEIEARTSCGQLWSQTLRERAALSLRARRSEAGAAVPPEKVRAWMGAVSAFRPRGAPLRAAEAGLLVVDMQEFFTHPLSPAYLPGAQAILGNVGRLVAAFRRAGRPVFFSRHAHLDPAADGGLMAGWWRKVCLDASPESRVCDALEAREAETFRKCRYSAFSNPELEPALRAHGARHLVVAGIVTNLCVESTVRAAFDAGFPTTVAADATAARSEEAHVAGLRTLAEGFSQVRPAADIAAAMGARA